MSGESDPAADTRDPKLREVRYCHTPSFVEVLRQLRASLLVSTYQAGKLATISAAEDSLRFSFHNLDQAMGIAVGPKRLAVGPKGQIWFFESNPQIAPSLMPAGEVDACCLARAAHVTGNFHCHKMAWGRVR
jgi:uncharacterized protein (TIGR03032 family)